MSQGTKTWEIEQSTKICKLFKAIPHYFPVYPQVGIGNWWESEEEIQFNL